MRRHLGTMVGGLEDNELRILALLKNAPNVLQDKLKCGLQLPRRLLEFSLMRRDERGELALLPAGERILFQLRCVDTLHACAAGATGHNDDADAIAWLLASRFLTAHEAGYRITSRGQEWLAAIAVPPLERDRTRDC
ncbi:MAG: hypothetical protein V4723_08995 [Pseudomonadota bacterium]